MADKGRFKLGVTDLHWVANAESTRWFLVLGINRPEKNELNRLLQVSNQTATDFGQASLYAAAPRAANGIRGRGRGHHPRAGRGRGSSHATHRRLQSPQLPPIPDESSSFHISIAWSLKPPAAELQATLKAVAASELVTLSIGVDSVKVKIGNNVSISRLSTKVEESRGIFGSQKR